MQAAFEQASWYAKNLDLAELLNIDSWRYSYPP